MLHEQDKGIKAYEHRIAQQNDVAKRRFYMKTHGIETKDPVTLVFGKGDDGASAEQIEAEALGRELPPADQAKDQAPARKKLFGLF